MSSESRFILILGGARSGKSTFAEKLAKDHGGDVLFVATAQPFDDEMRERIVQHQAQRPDHWHTLEAQTAVGEAIRGAPASDVVLLDCITLLANNVVLPMGQDDVKQEEANAALMAEAEALLDAFQARGGVWIVISNEVGLGVVPPYHLGRVYRDALGFANQHLARTADEVIFMVSGLPMRVK